jgi:3,4-dihydroxy-9,10-secoandrosta-1,3,5(10)-triene-9,17-dione 4,5-dioxygenase
MAIHSLGYVVARSSNCSEWTEFATQVLGLQDANSLRSDGDDAHYFKMDDRPYRIIVEPAEESRYGASGWECADDREYADTLARLREAGVAVEHADAEELTRRRVQALARFQDPSGNDHELYWGMVSDFSRFVSPVGVAEFVTGELGMGHTVLPAPNFDATVEFFVDVLGLGLSDLMKIRFTPDPAEPEKRLWFMHCNGRHHSLALFETPMPSGCVHIMLETVDLDEVGYAMDRREAHGVRLTATLGRHANDHMVSFYMATPSGFDVEFGAGGRVIDDWNSYPAFQSTVASLWGHDFSVGQQPPADGDAE